MKKSNINVSMDRFILFSSFLQGQMVMDGKPIVDIYKEMGWKYIPQDGFDTLLKFIYYMDKANEPKSNKEAQKGLSQ